MDKKQVQELREGMEFLNQPANSPQASEGHNLMMEAFRSLPEANLAKLCQLWEQECAAYNSGVGEPMVLPYFARECAPLIPYALAKKITEMNYVIFNLEVTAIVAGMSRLMSGRQQSQQSPKSAGKLRSSKNRKQGKKS